MTNIRALLLMSFFLFGCGSNMHSNVESSIGTAKMLEDGSIALNLIAEEVEGSAVGNGYFVYKPNDPYYEFIKRHLGGINIGDIKNVPPFPEKQDVSN